MNRQVSICIVAKNEAENIGATLKSIWPCRNDEFELELILVDNGSTDNTKEIFRNFLANNPMLSGHTIESPINNLALSRNLAVNAAKFPLLAFIDADCVAPQNWLPKFSLFFSEFSDPKLLAVGGGNHPPLDKSKFHSALNIALDSFWGSFGTMKASARGLALKVWHIPTCNIFFSKKALLDLGGFSSEFNFVCEDLELSVRAKKGGHHMLFLPNHAVDHHHKPGLVNWCRKMFRYGYGQILVAQKHPSHLWGLKGLPLFAAIIQILGLVFTTKLILMVDAFYLALTLFISIFSCFSKQAPALIPRVFMIFLATHLFYALGETWGAIHFWKSRIEK